MMNALNTMKKGCFNRDCVNEISLYQLETAAFDKSRKWVTKIHHTLMIIYNRFFENALKNMALLVNIIMQLISKKPSPGICATSNQICIIIILSMKSKI